LQVNINNLYIWLFFSFTESEVQYQANEWLGPSEDSRLVLVKLKSNCQLCVVSGRGTHLRTINMDSIAEFQIWISTNKGQKTLVVKMPKEYDLVRRQKHIRLGLWFVVFNVTFNNISVIL
jgi:hypothetical protein